MQNTEKSRLKIEGDASLDTIVLANSLAATLDMWEPHMDRLRARYRVVRFNYGGHGDAFQMPAYDNIGQMASELLRELSRAGVNRFSMIGVSLGGMLAIQLAATAASRTQAVVIANARCQQTPESQKDWSKRMQLVGQRGTGVIADATVQRWLSDSYRKNHPDTADWLHGMITSTTPHGYVAAAQAVRDFDGLTLLEQIRCPALAISGAEDLAAPPDHMDMIAKAVKGQHITLEAAHIASIEQGKAFMDAALELIEKRDAA